MLRLLATARTLCTRQGARNLLQVARGPAACSSHASLASLRLSRVQFSSARVVSERIDKEKASAALRQALTQEIYHEEENPPEPEDWSKYFKTAKWTITDKPGVREVTLSKVEGKDRVTVNMSLVDPEDDEFDEENPTIDIGFTVSVSKKYGSLDHGTLNFDAITKDGDISLVAVYHYPDTDAALGRGPRSDSQRVLVYPGPLMEELEEGLVDKFGQYLASMGIDREFAIMLEHMYYDKEQREYENWLKTLVTFLEAH